MSKDIKIKKGLDINLKGAAAEVLETAIVSKYFSIRPEDFHGVTPKLTVKVGSKVKAGEALFYAKSNEDLKFPSPVSGEVIEISRGEKRRVLAIKIEADQTQEYVEHAAINLDAISAEDLKSYLLASGCWPLIKQRPYDVIANPNVAPKAIFCISLCISSISCRLRFYFER